MSVAVPGGRVQIDFNIPGLGKVIVELDQRVAEIGAGLVIPETGVQNPDGSTIAGDEALAAEALVEPDRLQEPFGGRAVGRLPEQQDAQRLGAPLGVRD